MTDPYSVLGVSRNASEDEIKKAYRNLSRLYHPDANINSSDKDRVEQKFKEVQQAYKEIMRYKKEEEAFTSRYYDPFGTYDRNTQKASDGATEESYLKAAATYINHSKFTEALNVLNGMDKQSARWFYLSAMANTGLGNNVTALEQARRARDMDPGSYEFAALAAKLENGGNVYTEMGTPYGRTTGMCGNNMCLNTLATYAACSICTGFCFGTKGMK